MNHAKRNWKEYKKSLVNKGSLTIWIDPNAYAQGIDKSANSSAWKIHAHYVKQRLYKPF